METLRISETTERQLKDIAGEDKPSINAVHNEKQGAAIDYIRARSARGLETG